MLLTSIEKMKKLLINWTYTWRLLVDTWNYLNYIFVHIFICVYITIRVSIIIDGYLWQYMCLYNYICVIIYVYLHLFRQFKFFCFFFVLYTYWISLSLIYDMALLKVAFYVNLIKLHALIVCIVSEMESYPIFCSLHSKCYFFLYFWRISR